MSFNGRVGMLADRANDYFYSNPSPFTSGIHQHLMDAVQIQATQKPRKSAEFQFILGYASKNANRLILIKQIARRRGPCQDHHNCHFDEGAN
jgi:hypothetical protein